MNELKALALDNSTRLKRMADELAEVDPYSLQQILSSIIGFKKNLAYQFDRNIIVIKEDIVFDSEFKLTKGDFTDSYYTIIRLYLTKCGFTKLNKTTLIDVVDKMASDNVVYTFNIHLEEVKQKGKYDSTLYKEIMVNWLKARDEEYSIFWLKSLLGAIYRNQTYHGSIEGYDPVPQRYITFGAQGIGKSQFTKRLSFGSQMDFQGDISDRDSQQEITSKILINADDKPSSKTSVVDSIKSAITIPSFTFRPAYARTPITRLNRAVWVGSTNRLYVYSDTTGNRREMPIELGVGLSKDECREHGQNYYLNVLSKTPDMFLNLWFTFLTDLKEDKIDSVVKAGSTIDKQRIKVVNAHQLHSDLEILKDELMHTKVPNTLANNDKYDIISFLADENYKTGDKGNCLVRPYKEMIPLSDLKNIPAPALNKAFDLMLGRHYSVNLIESAMADEGFTTVVLDGYRFYRK